MLYLQATHKEKNEKRGPRKLNTHMTVNTREAVTYLSNFTEWMAENWQKEVKLFRIRKHRKLWRTMIADVLKEHGM